MNDFALSERVMTTIVTEWEDEVRPSSNILRLIYQGRFLHGNVTLAGNTLLLTVICIIKPHYVLCSGTAE